MVAAFSQIFSLVLNLFEKFIDVVFPSFRGLPIDLLVLYFEPSSGFHAAALINHLSFGDVAILIVRSSSNILSSHFHLFHCFNGAPFDAFNPVLFFE